MEGGSERKKDGSDSDSDSPDGNRFKETMLEERKRWRRAGEDKGKDYVPPSSSGIDASGGVECDVHVDNEMEVLMEELIGEEKGDDDKKDDSVSGEEAEKAAAATSEGEDKRGGYLESYSDFDSPGANAMTDERWYEYFRQVEESEGFDVEYFPPVAYGLYLFHKLNLPPHHELCVEPALRAIDWYNKKKKNALIKFDRVDKMITNHGDGAWAPLYITLQALDTADSEIKTYQAIVVHAPGLGYACRMFRLKPSENIQTDKKKKHPLSGCCDGCCSWSESPESLSPSAKKPKIDHERDDSEGEESNVQDKLEQSKTNYGEDQDDNDDDDKQEDGDSGDDQEDDDSRDDSWDNPYPEDDERGHYNPPQEDIDIVGYALGYIELEGYAPKYTLEDLEAYYEQVEESEGFDIDSFPDMESLRFITPVLPPWDDSITKHADRAIESLNKEGAQFKLMGIVTVNRQVTACCSHVYLTFEAKDGDDAECKTYQARILSKHGQEKVEEVRLKSAKC